MKITKLGHCCLLIKEQGLTILTDPGMFTVEAHESVAGIDVVLITHEHQDHLHVESLKQVLANNPNAIVITNASVGRILEKEDIAHTLVAHGQKTEIGGVIIEGFGEKHADIYKDVPVVENTGYFINNRFFYPGDALTPPGKPVDILAFPLVGPWLKISEAIEYGLIVRPKKAFPVHDALLTDKSKSIYYRHPERIFRQAGIECIALELGRETEL